MSDIKVGSHLLMPGDFYWGAAPGILKTTLGSCVAFTFWHPTLKVGGMCHFMVSEKGKTAGDKIDGKYAEDAMEMFLNCVARHRKPIREYKVQVFGAGNMFPSLKQEKSAFNVSTKNEAKARELIQRHNLQVVKTCLGEAGHRIIIFNLSTGQVELDRPERHSR